MRIKTSHGEYTGRTLDSIIRREYGRGARVVGFADANRPGVGDIMGSGRNPASRLGRVIWVETDDGTVYQDSMGAVLDDDGRHPSDDA